MLDEMTPVRADVPLDYHPDSLLGVASALNQPDTLGLSALSSAREALRLCYDNFARLNDAERDLQAAAEPAVRRQHPVAGSAHTDVTDNVRMVRGKPTRIVDAEEFIDAADRAFQRIAPAVDRRVTELKGYRATLEGRVAAAIDNPSRKSAEGLSLASEVRAHLKAMKRPDQRTQFVAAALAQGDKATVAAVIHAPAFLSGMTDETHAAIRKAATEKFAPVDSAQLAATDAALVKVMAAGSAVTRRFADVLAMRQSPLIRAGRSLSALREG